ncbi:UNVERIFIED_CONTAM: hypothetical protein GTU68_061853 [Idotea baltica]|nr:hypothetical protein [Idotea baltica]
MAELGGADQITVHLREDRRHIQDRDLHLLKQTVNVRLNLECACVDEMLKIACEIKPHQVCLVPEKRTEVTTEGGLNVVGQRSKVADAVKRLNDAGIFVSLFIDPSNDQIDAAKELNAGAIELHTGAYAEAKYSADEELKNLVLASRHANSVGLKVDAGHGLTYKNVLPVAQITLVEELNIGHSIISRSMFVGIQQAVREMKDLCVQAER